MASVLRPAVAVMLLSFFSPNLNAVSNRIPRGLQLRSAAAMVQDERTGELLLAKKPDVAMPIASITKLMTAMVILDAQLDMEAVITIDARDKDGLRHSASRLPVGTQLTRRQALILALMASENRAAHALGRTFPSGIGALVAAMNEKARSLGLSDTRFVDPTGLRDENVSSAQDLGRLIEAARRHPLICSFTTLPEYAIQRGWRQLRFVNTNALVRNPRWRIGISKTGYIEEGGRCLVMQTLVGRRSLLIVLLNSSGKNSHFADAMRIRQWIEASESPTRTEKNPAHPKTPHAQRTWTLLPTRFAASP